MTGRKRRMPLTDRGATEAGITLGRTNRPWSAMREMSRTTMMHPQGSSGCGGLSTLRVMVRRVKGRPATFGIRWHPGLHLTQVSCEGCGWRWGVGGILGSSVCVRGGGGQAGTSTGSKRAGKAEGECQGARQMLRQRLGMERGEVRG
jgi:hypothetical protein